MPSTLTLATLETRVAAFLMDAAHATFTLTAIDDGIRLALNEFSQVRPQEVITTFTPSAREYSLSGLGALHDVVRVWFPYTAATPEYPPQWCKFKVFWSVGIATLFLDSTTPPDGTKVARVFYRALHDLNGLDGAGANTFEREADMMLEIGAAAYCCYMRSISLNENAALNALSTPNYGQLADRLFKQFRALLAGARGAWV